MQRTYRFCLILLLFATAAKAQNPCDIIASVFKGCVPLPVDFTFKTTNTSAIVSYTWDFGDGYSSAQSGPTHIYTSAGSYPVKVTVAFQNGTQCTVSLSNPINVYHNPVSDFTVNNNQPILLCVRGNSICFADKSSPGADKAPIVAWQWTFGDGGSSNKQNPCYAYSDSGYYQVILQVTDSNGCTNYLQKTISVRYASDLGLIPSPKFSISIAFDCKKDDEIVTFTDSTDTAGQYITNFIWDFGDGTGDTCNLLNPPCLAKWTNFQHTYTKSGYYYPSLYVENKYGCSSTFSLTAPIIVQPYKLDPGVFNFSHCFIMDSTITDTVTSDPLALEYYWDYGDPYRRTLGFSAWDNHTYPMPGIYTVHIEVVVGTCRYDSTLCDAVKLLGPIALIMPVKGYNEAWDSVPPNGSFLIPPSSYGTYFDTTCLGPGFAKYYTYTPNFIKNGEPVYDSCKVDTVKTYQQDSLFACNGKKTADIILTFKQHIGSYKDTTEQIPTLHYWFRGNPFPTGNVYSDTPFVNRPLYMDDTSLFSLRCQAPQKISFTNFSDKYRGYYAVDNFPPGYPSKCLNKSYPYASDSLSYVWDFKEGSANTSTEKSPVDTDRYSTEKLPTHLFRKNGCYWVVLTTSDTATSCSDKDSLPVVLQAADAGWAPQYSSIKNMTALIQDSLPANGPRRGLLISGRPCIDSLQTINLNETLPSCFKRDFNMVLDSLHDIIKCGNHIKYQWLNKDTIANDLDYTFDYVAGGISLARDTGWKTIGLVVTNNYNCTDTVWYHDYEYIHGTYANINVSTTHNCLGDTLKMWPGVPEQLGIKKFTYYFTEQLDYGDTIAKPKPDTIKYQVVKLKNGMNDTITSTVHNRLWGIDDPANLNFNNLIDTTSIVVPYAGHFTITAVALSRFGCVDTFRTQITVGDYVDFDADNTVVCTNDTVHFQGIAQYFLPFTPGGLGYDTTDYWRNPYGHKEKMEWDFNGDGIIDATGEYPSYVYTKAGSYTVTLYTTDSNGCMQTLSRPNYIKVIGDSAYFTIAAPGGTRYCSGSHFFQFIDSSHIIKPFKDSLNLYRIYSWTWDFGDGSPALTITDSSKKNATHDYFQNGDYTVTLVIRTAPGTGANAKGCSDSFSRVIHILGPTSSFSILGSNKGCVPFTVLVRDQSKKASIREWLLGDGTAMNSIGDSVDTLIYKTPGVFCPEFFVADSVTDSTGKQLYCTDTFPYSHCQIEVVVYDTNKQVLTASDTLICLGTDSVMFKSTPDTGYTTWTIHYGNGDSTTKTNPQFSYLYTKTGKYHVFIDGSGAHCPDTASINIHVIDIKSYFTVDTARNDTPVFSFKNLSEGGVRYIWDFGDSSPVVNTTSAQEISHEFLKAGKLNICLTAINEKGCMAKYCDTIHIDTFLFIPNVFTPNGDAYNPTYDITIRGNLAYHLDIYNRWGQRVFHSDDKNTQWDGTNAAIGSNSQTTSAMWPSYQYPDGTYYYVFQYRFIGNKNEQAEGAVTLIR